MNICSLLFIVLIIPIIPRGRAESVNMIESCKAEKKLEKVCESYTFRIVKPMLNHFQVINVELDKLKTKDAEIEELKEKLEGKEEKNKSLSEKVKNYEETLSKTQSQLNEKELESCRSKEIDSCHDSGIDKLKVFGGDSIKVLCDANTAGTGWIVIQQRFDGIEDFFRDWAAYRNGFGSLYGDFFLGLENIHRLTSSGYNELYVRMESFDGTINFARYDDFKVDNEDSGYRLSSLGEFTGSGVHDKLSWHESMMFTTSDRDNDQWSVGNCADEAQGGWWYNACAASNLNGKYSAKPKTGLNTIYWHDYVALKTVRMLIRPREKCNRTRILFFNQTTNCQTTPQ